LLGSRSIHNRKVFLYMVNSVFVEVTYTSDNIASDLERVETFNSLDNLNAYLEKDFKNAF